MFGSVQTRVADPLPIILFVFFLAFFVSCTKSGALTGGSAPSGSSYSGTLTGSVNGGVSPVSSGLVALYAFGNSTPLATATTTSAGAFTISYTNPGGQSTLYLIVTGGNAGSGTNSNIQLAALLGQVTSVPSSVIINEMTTAAFMNVAYNYGAVQDANGTVSFPSINGAGVTNMLAQYNNLIANGASNGSLSTSNQNALAAMANSVAACIENSASCSTLFNNAINLSQSAAISIQDALYNIVNAAPVNLTNLYKMAAAASSTTGYALPGSNQTLLNIQPIITSQTFSAGSAADGLAVDGSGNLWVTNNSGNSVMEFSPSGSLLGTFSPITNPAGIAIDATGNLWMTNFTTGSGTTVTELNSSGTTIGTFTVGTHPHSLMIDSNGNVWVTNWSSSNVTELNSSGATVGTFSVGTNPAQIEMDANGTVWVDNQGGTISRLNSSGNPLGNITAGSTPDGILIDPRGNICVVNNA